MTTPTQRFSRPLCTALALLFLVLGLSACGGGSGSSNSTPAEAGRALSEGNSAKPHQDSGGGSAQFLVKGGDNSVQEFGAEGSESELRAAADALHGFLDARAARNWAAACGYLAKSTAESFQQLATGSGGSCSANLGALTGKTPTATLREAAVANVGSLRVKGDRGFLIYRGAGAGIYTIAVTREGGAWKVATLGGVPLS